MASDNRFIYIKIIYTILSSMTTYFKVITVFTEQSAQTKYIIKKKKMRIILFEIILNSKYN